MVREIYVPNLNPNLLKFAIQNNDDILLSFCRNKQPKRGFVTQYGMLWSSFEDFENDAENVCHYFYQLYVFTYHDSIFAPSHADEIYNQKINPYTF